MKKIILMLFSAGASLLALGVSQAGEVNGLAEFRGGTPALASEVNANFSAVAAAVNDNHARISANTAAIVTNTQAITGIQTRTEGACAVGFARIGLWCLDEDGVAGNLIRSTTSIENNSGSTATNVDLVLGLPVGMVRAAVVRTVVREIANASSTAAFACVSSRALSMSDILVCAGAAIETGLIAGQQAIPTQIEHVVPVDGNGNLHTFCVWGRTEAGQAVCRWNVMGYTE